ncbi:alkaline phosphatase D family protein [Dokdonella sp.]|uniref:alkaline phosphatase D family protein n=1 Tax=Dokdonella sp. TaxID=2291710 RepID=UPI003782F4CF
MHDATRGHAGWSRRQFILGGASALGLAGLALGSGPPMRGRFDAYPFALGVASGDPSADGFVLWTRIATAHTDALFLPMQDYEVDWVVAEDEALSRVVRRGRGIARAESAHALHVEVDGLDADRWYWYRFHCGGEASPIGRSRTLPAAGARVQRLRLALASCQHYEHGWYAAYRHMLGDDLDLVLHVGDYIYEGSWGPQLRRHESPHGAQTLADYRNRHACYKSDADLQRAHAAYPWLVTWDDHEVSNDYAGLVSAYGEAPSAFATRRSAAYRAYCEHMPLRARSRAGNLLYRRFAFGDLATLSVLDDRQYRAAHACAERGAQLGTDCGELRAPQRSLLGAHQQEWLERGLADSDARWNVIGQQTLVAPFVSRGDDAIERVWNDGWDGYPRARERLLGFIGEQRIRNVVTLGGDVHAFYANDLKVDFADPASTTVASEFVGTSISSAGDDYAERVRDLHLNPHVRYFDSRSRGYLRCEITPDLWRSDCVAVDDVSDPHSRARTLASLHVETGRAGVQV